MRKQTHGNSSAPSARSPRARHRLLRSPRARPPGQPSPPPHAARTPPPRPAPAGAGSLTYRPTRARARAPRAPRRPPGSWPLESKVRAMRGDPGGFPARLGRGKFLASLFSAEPGEAPGADQAEWAGGDGPAPGGHKLPNLTLVLAGGLRGGAGGARRGAGGAEGPGVVRAREGPEELSPPRRGSFHGSPRPRHGSSGLPGWKETMKCV